MSQSNLTKDDIATAKELAIWANGCATTDPERLEERLFRTADGRYFLHTARGANNALENEYRGLAEDEARAWVERRQSAEQAQALFRGE